MAVSGSGSVIRTALLANLGIALAKAVGAFVTGSTSLIAESIHSAVDCANQVLLLIGNRASRKPPSETHPLGYGREAFFWSFLVAIFLFSLGGIFAIREGLHKFDSQVPLEHAWIGFPILILGIFLEGYALKSCIAEIRRQKGDVRLWQWFRRTKTADLLVVFTEDMAAVAGLIVALVCLGLSIATQDPRWDALGSILVGCLLGGVAVLLALEIKSLLIGEAAHAELRPGIEAIVREEIPGGTILRFIAIQIGSSEVLVSYKVSPGQIESAKDLIDSINRAERRVRAKFPEIRWQFVEPDFEP
jgi:cation diffusion facilitator family transporter